MIGSGADRPRRMARSTRASFNHPQGMALVGDTLYVADTENHLLRKVDLATSSVTTVAGTGEQGDGFPGPLAETARFGGPPLTTALTSPWALWLHGTDLYIAMAGPHQIWKMPLDDKHDRPVRRQRPRGHRRRPAAAERAVRRRVSRRSPSRAG